MKQEKKVPREAHTKLIEHLLKLKDSKNATNEQLRIIAKTYGINLDGSRVPKLILIDEENVKSWER